MIWTWNLTDTQHVHTLSRKPVTENISRFTNFSSLWKTGYKVWPTVHYSYTMDPEKHFVPLKYSMRARLHKIEYAVNWMLENGDWTVDVLPYVGLEELDEDSVDWNDTRTVILDVDGNYMQVRNHALKHYNMVNEQGEHEPFKLAHFFTPMVIQNQLYS